jgi:hypothetical protein
MNQRSEYLIQILEKIGAPLMGAIADVGARQNPKTPPEAAAQDAQKMAELLARSVQCSIEIGKSIDMASMPDQGESMRLALTALASGAIAGQYQSSGRTPGENELKRTVTALQAVLTFSENFTPDPANIERLKQMQAQGAANDAGQVGIQYLQAFLPVVNAIGNFSFGQPEKQAIQDVSNRLTKKAAELKTKLFPGLSDDEGKLAELALVRCLTSLYASCHEAEITRLAGLSDDQRASASLSPEPVWSAFEIRAAMLETIAPAILGNAASDKSSGGGKAPAPPPLAPVQQVPLPPPPAQQGGSPLSMFAAKPQQAAAPPPPPPPPAPPPEQSAPPPHSPSGDQQQGGAAPMSFFKKSG